ncbi:MULTISPECIES: LamG-like jellyroll fold domain-containing protein [Catenuloplanes]|uniref:Fibronectin type-III domain-containing protein n=1 Tax=Catenuloplanes niger TaxID=587534 RepID=A0AAE3ZJL9_9ACTN|nr:LamG-like jellyroll fold domain-containing protein [Catenuloplanes niger]MDR7320371.1 hypothetical protein [Catenuloplanes niger]
MLSPSRPRPARNRFRSRPGTASLIVLSVAAGSLPLLPGTAVAAPGTPAGIAGRNTPPTAPTGLQPAGNGSTCGAVGTLTATFQAVPHDPDGGSQSVEWQWAEVDATGTYRPLPAPAATTASSGGVARAEPVPLTEGTAYAFRARSTDAAPRPATGPWSAWCEFHPDVTRPAQPTITMVTAPTGPGTPVEYRITSPDADVTTFRYGWSQTPLSEVAATTSGALRTATVRLSAPTYGLINLYAYGVDAARNDGVLGRSADFIVPAPRAAIAHFGLETYPGTNESAALADQQPAWGGDTPLTTTGTVWTEHARLRNVRTLTFGDPTARAEAPGLTPDTTASFSVAAWVRLDDLDGTQTIAATDGGPGGWSPFRLQFRGDDDRWCMTLNARLDDGTAVSACSPTAPVAGRWTHVAGSWDATEGTIRIWVDGVPTAVPFTTPLTTGAPFLLGRATNAGGAAEQLRGGLADARFFDRVLTAADLTGTVASDPGSGGLTRIGLLHPVQVADWSFGLAGWCYEEGNYQSWDWVCQAPDSSPFNRRLSTTTGASVATDRDGGNALELNGTHFTDDPSDPHHGESTVERAYAQWNTAPAGQEETWVHSPIVRTDQSFTVSAWLRPDALPAGTHPAVSIAGDVRSAVEIGIRTYTVDGVAQRRWAIVSAGSDSAAAPVSEVSGGVVDEAGLGSTWTHVTAAFDASTGTARLYVNGDLVADGPWQGRWPANGPLTLGAGRDGGAWTGQWYGALDDVRVFHGVGTDGWVRTLATG